MEIQNQIAILSMYKIRDKAKSKQAKLVIQSNSIQIQQNVLRLLLKCELIELTVQ